MSSHQEINHFFVTSIYQQNHIEFQNLLQTHYDQLEQILNLPLLDYHQNIIFLICKMGIKGVPFLQSLVQLNMNFDYDHIDYYSQTPLYYVAKDGCVELLDLLIQRGINLNHCDNINQTALYYAAREGRVKMIDKMIIYGGEINHQDNSLETPLMYTIFYNQIESCRKLLELGANFQIKNKDGFSAIKFAQNIQNEYIINLLIEFGADYVRQGRANLNRNLSKLQDSEPSSMIEKITKKKPTKKIKKNIYNLQFSDNSLIEKNLEGYDLTIFQQNFPNIYHLLQNPEIIKDLQCYEQVKNKYTWQQAASQIIQNLWKMNESDIFHFPVDPIALGVPNYPEIIKNPMDFNTIKKKLNNNLYPYFQNFEEDIILVFDNCILFNGEYSYYGEIAQKIKKHYHMIKGEEISKITTFELIDYEILLREEPYFKQKNQLVEIKEELIN